MGTMSLIFHLILAVLGFNTIITAIKEYLNISLNPLELLAIISLCFIFTISGVSWLRLRKRWVSKVRPLRIEDYT